MTGRRLTGPAIAPYAGKGTGETTLPRQIYDSQSPGDVVVADALSANYFLACELRWRGIELIARVQANRVGSRTVESGSDGDIIIWERPSKPRGMTGQNYRRYPESLTMRQVSVDDRWAAGGPRQEGGGAGGTGLSGQAPGQRRPVAG